MTRQTHFEVHVQQHGRWTIHARYPLAKKDSALDDAKQLDAQKVGQVKVIREVFDDETGSHEEYTIYKTPIAGQVSAMEEAMGQVSTHKPRPMGRQIHGAGPDIDFDLDDLDRPRRRRGKKSTSVSVLLVKILVMILFATMLAGIATASSSVWVDGVNFFGTRLVGPAKNNALSAIFFITFATAAVVLSAMFFRNDTLAAGKRRAQRKQKKQDGQKPGPAQTQEDKKKKEAAGVSIAAAVEELRRSFDEDGLQAANEDNPGAEKPGEDPQKPQEQGMMLSPAAEKQKQFMMTFMKRSMPGIPDIRGMDNFNKFGVNLYLAGACESLAHKSKLSGAERTQILGGAVSAAGFKKNRAAAFAKRYEEYLGQDARYTQIFEAGRKAMTGYFTDVAQAPQDIKKAMDEWAQPAGKSKEEGASGEISVLFTDIAGSTALTQKLGDIGAQQVVRAHNKVVREALTAHGGREVKHTGDGIMASFRTPASAVMAAADMQKGAMAVRNALKLPLHLKIGVNAGEAIQEDNDLFGTTVQMAARIVDIARADEIIVSETVQSAGKSTGREFINRGAFAMKGFDQDPMVWEVKWWDGAQSPKLKTGKAAGAAQPRTAPAEAPAQTAQAAQAGGGAAQAAQAGGAAPARRSGVRLVQPPRQ